MKIKRIVKPGQPGTKKLVEKYGDNLVCVRYRYDVNEKRKLKTIELIIENTPWQPNQEKIPLNKLMNIRIMANEYPLRIKVKAAGGSWDHQHQVWRLPYAQVLELGLNDRIVE
jgi:hypothetical protein